jgi:hypothetical protein
MVKAGEEGAQVTYGQHLMEISPQARECAMNAILRGMSPEQINRLLQTSVDMGANPARHPP